MQLLRLPRLLQLSLAWSMALSVLVTEGGAQNRPAGTAEKPASSTVQGASVKNASPAAPESGPLTANKAGGDAVLRLGVGDLVDVSVYNVPELTSKARVGDNGNVYLPLIDYVHVAGLTPDEAQTVIEKRLSDGGFVKSPHVTIFIEQYASQGVSLLGEVARPGVYPVLGQQRLFDLISAAGGLSDRAGKSVTITHRRQPDKPVTVALARNLADSPEANVEVFPGDLIVVRKADVVYVVGDVARPSGLLIDRGSLTVLQAIALAGGTTRTSRLNGTRIIHRGPDGMSETHVELKRILEAKAPDVAMSADDILFVPSSALKSALQDNASIAMQAASLGLVAIR
jgi:polysaccharide export outer membrane protein